MTAQSKPSSKPQHIAVATICAVLVFVVWTFSLKLLSANTLVVYVFSDTEAQYSQNLEFFLKEAVRANDGADYFIILQGGTQETVDKLPRLPPNARYVLHENKCYDLGSVGWLINQSGLVKGDHYKYVIWLNSSARGPFLPDYVRRTKMTWHEILTQHIDKEVKLVGATLSCQERAHKEKGKHHVPHIQTYVVATDNHGLRVLQNAAVLTCHNSYEDAVVRGELTVSKAILDAGFNIFSMMARYKGVDWRNRTNWHCNGRMNPIHGPRVYDGIDVHPYEVLFVKVKQDMMVQGWPSVKYALKYQEWLQAGAGHNVTSNERITRLVDLATKYGLLCFDAAYYRKMEPDLGHLDDNRLLAHFITHGAREGRHFRLRCGRKQYET